MTATRRVTPAQLARAAAAARAAEQRLQAQVDQARAEGATWSAIGAALGISKQGAQQRFSKGSD